MCAKPKGALCLTCRLGGLIRCPVLGVPLPLVEGERAVVETKARKLYPNGPELTEGEALKIWKWMSERRRG
jgi:hypothetical protein